MPSTSHPVRLGVNIDHVATVREARQTSYPDPVSAAHVAERAGADSIVLHVRKDRRHVSEHDLERLIDTAQTRINLEMARDPDMVEIARNHRPHRVTLVPEERDEVTTEGGLDVVGNREDLIKTVERLQDRDIQVFLFVDPAREQIRAAGNLGVKGIELHTGNYANTSEEEETSSCRKKVVSAAEQAYQRDLDVAAGHGLTFHNIGPIVRIPEIEEVNIGHSIVSRALFSGMEGAVRDMIQEIAHHAT